MPELRIVARTPEATITRREARLNAEIECSAASIAMEHELSILAANMLRVMRGGGKPKHLHGQLVAALSAMNDWVEVLDRDIPQSEIYACLSMPLDETLRRNQLADHQITDGDVARWREDGTTDMQLAIETICRGALQVVASRHLDQFAHETIGETEIFDGIAALEKARGKSQRVTTERPRKVRRKASRDWR
jgi:hypothetical protein